MNASWQLSSRSPFPPVAPGGTGSVVARAGLSFYSLAAGTLVTSMFLPLVVLLGANLRRLLLAVVFLEMMIGLDVNLALREDPAQFGALEGFSVSLTTLALVGLYTSWAIGFLVREPSSRRPIRMNWPLAVYMGFVALSMLNAYDVELSQFELFLLAQAFLVHVYVASALRTRKDILFAVGLLLTGIILEAILVIPSVAARSSISIAGITSQFELGRASGTLGSPILLASYLALLLAPSASVMLAAVSRGLKVLALVAFVFGTLALIFTLSRGAWISFTLSMTLLGVAAWWRGYISLKVPVLTAIAVLLLALPFAALIGGRITGDDGGSARARLPLAILASRVIEDHPWLGIGPNNFALVGQRYITSQFADEWFFVVHNKYLLVWAETGLFGLLAFLLFLLTTLRGGWRLWRRADPVLAPLAIGFTVAIIGHMEHMSFDVFRSRPQVQTLWLISGLIVAMTHVRTDA
jgi:O-antigen ligase